MSTSIIRLVLHLWLICGTSALRAQEAVLPPGDDSPILRLDVGGPSSYVSGMAFSPDGRKLYAGGWDKLVHVWTLDGERFVYQPRDIVRIPVGAGLDGGISTIALSPDGQWLAVAGRGYARQIAGPRNTGWIWPAASMSDATRLDRGLIYVYHTGRREVRLLRGHLGPVQVLTFVEGPGEAPLLVSAAEENEGDQTALIVRAWNVDTRRQLGEPLQLGRAGWPPRIVAWKTDAAVHGLRAAIAWESRRKAQNGQPEWTFSLWEPGERAQAGAAPVVTRSAILLDRRRGRVLTGAHAEIGEWSVPAALRALQKDRDYSRTVTYAQSLVAEAGAMVSANANADLDHAAFVVTDYRDKNTRRHYLRLVDHRQKKFVGEWTHLWSGEDKVPTIAASPRGRFVAVAGNSNHSIRLYDVRRLIDGEKRPHQELVGRGRNIGKVSFARRGDAWGLLLDGNKVFDVANRTVVDRDGNWRPVAPPGADRWQAVARQTEAGDTFPVTVKSPQAAQRQIRPADEDSQDDNVTATSICPVVDENVSQVPLLAVATHDSGEPRLVLYNADTGDELRWLTGHTERIHSLAFSDDGKFLVSAAEDRTVRVWSLTDLAEKTLGKRGLLDGLSVRFDNGRLKVVKPGRNDLDVGQTIQGVVVDGKLREFPAAWEFYHFVSRHKPGERLTLKVGAGGGRDIELVVDQAIDERKPLFSLFLATDGPADRWQWIGWNPLGPYDVSDRDFETQLGWHFNTGEARAPVRFAHVEEYRDDNLRLNLLRELLEQGTLPAAPPPPEPETSLHFETHDGVLLKEDYDNAEHWFSRTSQLNAILDVDNIRPELVESVDLTVDGKVAGRLAPRTGELATWSADLSGLNWSKRQLKFGVILYTRETRSRTIVPHEIETVRFQPPPPELATDVKNFDEVRDARFPFAATVSQVVAPGTVELIHEFDDERGRRQRESIRTWKTQPDQDVPINEFLDLAPGDNDIRVVALNDDAPERYRHFEESLLIRTITLKAAKQPAIGRLKLKHGDNVADVAPLVDAPAEKVAVLADVEAPPGERLAKVRLTVRTLQANPTDEKVVHEVNQFQGFDPGQTEKLKLETEITFIPGRQRIVIEAEATDKSVARTDFVVVYRPEFPKVLQLRLEQPEFVKQPPPHVDVEDLPSGVLYAGLHKPQATLVVELSSLPEAIAADAKSSVEILADGKPLPVDGIEVDRDRKSISSTLSVPPGPNSMQLRLKIGDVTGPLSTGVTVDYRRPPYFEQVVAEDRTASPSIPLTATVISELPLAKGDVEVKVNDGRWRPADGVRLEQDGDRWQLAIEQVPLEPEREQQAIYVRAANTDGGSVVTGFKRVAYVPDNEIEKLMVGFYVPLAAEVTTDMPEYEVSFQVESTRLPIEQVQLLHDGYPIGEVRRGLKAGERHTFSQSVSLHPAQNLLEVEAIASRNGKRFTQRSEPLTLSLAQQPVAIRVDFVESIKDDNVQRLQNQAQDDGVLFEDAVKHNYVTIHGHVDWPREDKRRAVDREAWVKSWANGFRHDLGQLDADGSFTIDVLLNKGIGNHVEVEMPLPQEASNPNGVFKLDCLDPLKAQWLHLLVVDGDAADDAPEISMDDLKTALRAAGPPGAEAALPSFEHVERYGPLTGQLADAGHIKSQLKRNIAPRLRRKLDPRRRLANDVVIVFFRGWTKVTEDNRKLLLPRKNASSRESIASTEMGQILEDHVPGAHVFLGDFEGDRLGDDIVSEFHRSGILVVVWPDGQRPRAEDGLIAALAAGIDRAVKLPAVFDGVAEFFEERGYLHKGYVPEPLGDLLIGSASNPVPPPK